MFALRYAALLMLVMWVGGLLALGAIAAPAIFDVLAARQTDNARMLARRVEFGRLHGLSTALELVPVLGGLMLIFWEIRE